MKMELKTDIAGQPYVEVSEAYSGISIKTDAGSFAICQRDQGIEIRLGDGPWFGWQEKKGPVRLGPPKELPVSIGDLKHMASMCCENGETDSCENNDYGGKRKICNGCWTRRLAERLLRGAGLDHVIAPSSKEPEPDDDGSKPLGSLDRFRHG